MPVPRHDAGQDYSYGIQKMAQYLYEYCTVLSNCTATSTGTSTKNVLSYLRRRCEKGIHTADEEQAVAIGSETKSSGRGGQDFRIPRRLRTTEGLITSAPLLV